ncbi:MAG TPA: hypothetical protein VFK57_14185 [Vicinamibacterales bacterium]|nr:hypothetical protein [Vicinamibacterales bacterium]
MSRTCGAAAAVCLSVLIGCGGGGGGGNSGGNGGGSGGGGGGTTPVNPCTTALLDDPAASAVSDVPAAAGAGKKIAVDGNPRGRVYEALALHEAAKRKREADARAAAVTDQGFGRTAITSPAPVAEDIGEIAVLQDTGDLILPANPYDLRSTGLRFTRSGGGYTLSKVDGNFRSALGARLTLTDDDSAGGTIPFAFPFYGGSQTQAFVNSDGNITFGEEDKSSTERNVARVLTGPPRVAPFFTDLDPTTGSGRIFLNAAPDAYTVTWCGVRGFDSVRVVTAQATLFPDGSIEFKYGETINIFDSVVGISPGHTADVALLDLSNGSGSGAAAIAERFAQQNSIDTFAVAQKFYQTHPDNYDQIVLWTDQSLIRDAFAYELTVANEVRGIGLDIYDLSRSLGSGGRVRSLVVMDWIGKYPDNPQERFLGENNTLSVLGQEVGHRWGAYLEFRDHTGRRSDALLGRDLAHWSFHMDSDASVLEGNDIEDLGGGQFRTTEAVKRFSRLDQYAMGLVPASLVPPFFYVENPSARERGDSPATGVTFTGTRRDVLINDVVAILGPRIPSAAESARVHRQAFIYIVTAGRTAEAPQIAKLDRIRQQWETFFLNATEGRMTANTRLR